MVLDSDLHMMEPDDLEETWKEHASILTAPRARDGAKTERLMRQHLELARSIADMLNVARVYAATAVDACTKKRDVLKLRDQWAEELV